MFRALKKLGALDGGSLVILVFILRYELLSQDFGGAISLEIEKIGLSEQVQTDIWRIHSFFFK